MDKTETGGALAGDDEFSGLGDDLFIHERRSADEILGPEEKPNKEPRMKKTLRQKALRVMLKRSGLKSIPPIEQILQNKEGPRFPICEIGFLSQNKQKDPLMMELAKECPVRSRISQADVLRSRVLVVGSQILKDGRMMTPIHVYQDLDQDERLECISGRHRLAFLALVYGSDLMVPVYMEKMKEEAAREAIAVANDSRPVKALERASVAILRAVGGRTEVSQDQLYEKMSTLKPNIGKYCVFSVIGRGYPAKLNFKTSERSSRPDGGITTVSNVEGFWKEAISWTRGMARKDFDGELQETVSFLNDFVAAICKIPGFDPAAHLSAQVMTAVGRYYQTYRKITQKNAIVICRELARNVVSVDTNQKRTDVIYKEIASLMVGL
jgi:hypothetical protein